MRNYILLALLFASLYNYAQISYQGKISNSLNQPLAGATITAIENSSNTVISNSEGNFEIEGQEAMIVNVSFLGYSSVKVKLSKSFNQIRLIQNNEALDEVLVTSASREIQKRSEVPGAIATIDAATIASTKAFGLDQLVNQVPGVLMSTSRAASNEQHFMAVRSPISTKSLFLYLEDGLPIRPTAVFNHNALLEMNSTAFGRIEVLKGPASSIYGSEAIGGSFNIITKNPTPQLSGGIDFQTNDLGLSRYELELSKQTNEKLGLYIGGHFVKRVDGPIEHSDYEKLAVTFKTVYDFSPKTKWTTVLDLVDYRSDMTGSLSESDYSSGNYESDQTFTERIALAFRARTTLDQFWNERHKTSFNLIFRENHMDQNPSYRVRQFRNQGKLTGFGSGELNSNQFRSFVGLIQHKINFDFADSSLILGGTTDYSPQKYVAETLDIIVDPVTGRNIDFTLNSGDYILNYKADILNYAGYLQYEISPMTALKITAALRYDRFDYDYDNQSESVSGARDSKNSYDNLAPKLGLNYNFSKHSGLYTNFSQGFSPPQTSTLYRNGFVGVGGEVFDLKPSQYNNYEIGGYFTMPSQLKLDAALYYLEGKNTLITLRDENDEFFNTNAGKTQSIGVEYGITYMPVKGLSLTHNGSYAKHRYVSFFDRGIDYSDTDRETAPNLMGSSLITYQKEYPNSFNFGVTLEHELIGKYNTSFENQVEVTDENGDTINDSNGEPLLTTTTYKGHNIFNARLRFGYKNFEIWGHALNLLDELYAARASYNRFRNENSYTIGNPRAFHLGLRYNF